MGYKIGKTIGEVEEVDVTGEGLGWGRCLRIRVCIDLTKPLERGRALNLNGKTVWVSLDMRSFHIFVLTVVASFITSYSAVQVHVLDRILRFL